MIQRAVEISRTQPRQWDYSGNYLGQFPRNAQSTVANLFCNAVRRGASEPDTVIAGIEDDMIRRESYGVHGVLATCWRELRASLDTPDAVDFALFIIWRESLTPAEREQLKNAKGREHIEAKMAADAATERQVAYLKSLNCPIVPTSKLHASQLIEQYKKGGNR